MRKSTLWSAVALAAVCTLTGTTAQAAPAGIARVSTDTGGGQLAGASSGATVSADGRYAAFLSADPTGGYDTRLYVKDLRTGALSRVPEDLLYTTHAVISANGRRVAYSDGNRYPKPYVYDRATGETQLLWPAQLPDDSLYELGEAAAISADGRHVAYTIGNRHGDEYARVLYVRDLATGTDERISPVPPTGMITGASLSADGRTVAYGLLVRGDRGAAVQIYSENRDTGGTRRVDTGDPAGLVRLSTDGRRILFDSTAQDGTTGAYIRDLRTGAVRRIADTEAAAADGTLRHVLLTEDTGPVLLDRRTGARRSAGPAGSTALPGAVTRNGRAVVLASTAEDLVPGDTNGVADVFVVRPS
ncbi:TolB family protein [Streptomyces sp. NPDC005784]|uniref:TolB family protein n=1 Tax=Streptomyces sp. NPDC005784 TaxID=3364731 RepID=UPI0036B4C0CD